MNRHEAMEALLALEQAFDVTTITYQGIPMYPLLRFALWQQMVASALPNTVQPKETPYPPISPRQALQSYIQAWQVGQVDALFFSSEVYYTDQHAGRAFNRHVDPIVQELASFRTQKIEVLKGENLAHDPRFIPAYLFDPRLFRFEGRLWRGRLPKTADNLAPFLALAKARYGIEYAVQSAIFSFMRLVTVSDMFERLLVRLRPKLVLMPTYYSPDGLALMLACSRRNVPTVDIQHGMVDKIDIFYNHWQHLPMMGYPMLPRYFWFWSEREKSVFESTSAPHNPHRALVGGNAWIRHWRSHPSEQTTRLKARFASSAKRILVTLQPTESLGEPMLTEGLLGAMAQSDTTWVWLLRLHPLYRTAEHRADVRARLEARHIHNYELDEASDQPLYALLELADWHVTSWSSVALEALEFRVPTILVHPQGADAYAEWVREGAFLYGQTAEEILTCLSNERVMNTAYFEQRTAATVLGDILKK